MTWPAFFPESCPPSDSKSADCDAYRVVVSKQQRDLNAKDFYSRKKKKPDEPAPVDNCPCEWCGVSIAMTLEDGIKTAHVLLKFVPAHSRRKAYIVVGKIEPYMGTVKHTPDKINDIQTHHDWWIPEECTEPHTSFDYTGDVVEKNVQMTTEMP
jgi:hypothetical protein